MVSSAIALSLVCCVQVVERHWYERNKHIFPASRWEIFDPEKNYGDKYTIKG